jgi:hypothetical protein
MRVLDRSDTNRSGLKVFFDREIKQCVQSDEVGLID